MSDHGRAPLSTQAMSLRDFFAAFAMHAELLSAGTLPEPRDALVKAAESECLDVEDKIARNAYEVADAMLREREEAPR